MREGGRESAKKCWVYLENARILPSLGVLILTGLRCQGHRMRLCDLDAFTCCLRLPCPLAPLHKTLVPSFKLCKRLELTIPFDRHYPEHRVRTCSKSCTSGVIHVDSLVR